MMRPFQSSVFYSVENQTGSVWPKSRSFAFSTNAYKGYKGCFRRFVLLMWILRFSSLLPDLPRSSRFKKALYLINAGNYWPFQIDVYTAVNSKKPLSTTDCPSNVMKLRVITAFHDNVMLGWLVDSKCKIMKRGSVQHAFNISQPAEAEQYDNLAKGRARQDVTQVKSPALVILCPFDDAL